MTPFLPYCVVSHKISDETSFFLIHQTNNQLVLHAFLSFYEINQQNLTFHKDCHEVDAESLLGMNHECRDHLQRHFVLHLSACEQLLKTNNWSFKNCRFSSLLIRKMVT
jgi:hypothetical protein